MVESDYGNRDKRGHYKPNEQVSYPPVFVWPLKPIRALKWVFSIPGYFVPWNLFYVLVGLLSWFYFSPPLEAYAHLNIKVFLIAFARNSVLVALYFGAFHYRLYTLRAQDLEFKFNPRWPA
ncbi:hypothetical protein N8Z41_00155 [Amylibacter sp.]|nr:hypothetical protein [Amylibacter sp.]MDC1246881.1 hypothetical protein [Amylibacter sp.]